MDRCIGYGTTLSSSGSRRLLLAAGLGLAVASSAAFAADASRRAALNQWWTPQNPNAMQMINVGGIPRFCAADGEDIWASTNGQVVQVQANTGKVLGTWTGASNGQGVLVAAGKVYVVGRTGRALNGELYEIDPTKAPGAVTVVASNLANDLTGIAFDGTSIWIGSKLGSVSIVTPQATTPYPVTTVSTGFQSPIGVLYDGAHIWVTDEGAGKLFRLDASGNIVQTVAVGSHPVFPAFDGTNIWVPDGTDNLITVVQASSGNVVATINANTTNQLNAPFAASFDGERILVTNFGGSTVTLFRAADLSFIANVTTGPLTEPAGTCSDGINFWVSLANQGLSLPGNLLRF